MAITHPTAVRNALCDLVVDRIDAGAGAGTLKFLTSGTNPANEVATLTFPDPAFDDAGSTGGNADGVATANAITSDTSATGGVTTTFIIEDSDGTDVMYGAVGTSGSDINLSSTTIGVNDTVSISSLTYTAPL
jgi:hypothetical protein